MLPLQHTDHLYSPANNHPYFVSYLVMKLHNLLERVVVEDYLKISARTAHIFSPKNLQHHRRPVFLP